MWWNGWPDTISSRRPGWRLQAALALVAAGISLTGAAGTPTHLEDALQAQRSLVEKSPDDVKVLNDLGNLLALSGRVQEAEEVYRRALGIEAHDVTARYNLALVLEERGETKMAMRELRTVVKQEPRHAWAHYQLGNLHANAKRRAKAIDHYERAFILDRSLTSPEVNPHIVENRYVTEVMLRLYRTQPPSTQAPRLYQQPSSVARMLLPSQPGELAPETEAEAPPRPRATFQPGSGASATSLDERREAEPPEAGREPSKRVLDETTLTRGGGSAATSSPRPSRRFVPRTPSAPRAGPQSSGPASTPGAIPRSSGGDANAPRIEPDRPAPSVDETPFRPDLPSTGRLELQLHLAGEQDPSRPAP